MIISQIITTQLNRRYLRSRKQTIFMWYFQRWFNSQIQDATIVNVLKEIERKKWRKKLGSWTDRRSKKLFLSVRRHNTWHNTWHNNNKYKVHRLNFWRKAAIFVYVFYFIFPAFLFQWKLNIPVPVCPFPVLVPVKKEVEIRLKFHLTRYVRKIISIKFLLLSLNLTLATLFAFLELHFRFCFFWFGVTSHLDT